MVIKFRADENPFNQQQLERLAFRFPDDRGWESNLLRLKDLNWRGSIVGQRGSGKSTLLRQFHRRITGPSAQAANPFSEVLSCGDSELRSILLDVPRAGLGSRAGEITRAAQRAVVGRALGAANTNTIVFVDGIERLTWLDRRRLVQRECGRDRVAGLIVNRHRPTQLNGLPVWIETTSSMELMLELLSELQQDSGLTMEACTSQAECLMIQYRGNIREVFRGLYDLAASGNVTMDSSRSSAHQTRREARSHV